jgi:PAS domain S-box-containing protein
LKDIREAEEKYRGIVNNAVMGVYQVTDEGKFLLANPSMARMFGFKSPEEFLTSVPNISQFYVHSEDRAQILTHMKTKGFVDEVEIQFRRRDKETIWVSASARIVKDKPGETIYEGFMLDITDRKRAEEEIKKHQDHLEELVEERTTELRIINEELEREIDERKKAEEAIHNSEQRLSDIIDFLPDATFVIDKEGRVILWNRAMEELTEVKAENMLGKGDHEYAIPLYGERRPTLIDQLSRRDKRIVKEYLLFREEEDTLFSESYHPDLRPGGAYLSGAAHSLCDTKGEVIGAIESSRDITWRIETEKELTEANIRLKELDQLKSMFLASMSHELRTPLNSIIGFISWLLMGMEGDLNEEQTKQLTMAKNSADHLLNLVNDILDISKIESGKLDISIEEFEIAEVVKDVAAAVLPQAKDKGLELHVDVTERIKLKSDTQRVKQVLLNLVSNAVKFTDHGKIKIRVEASGTGNLEIIVLDKGIGIREEDMDKLFEPFQQIDMSYTKEHEGTGLGLYLCKKLLDLLHGDISVKSESGKGSEFKVTLPLKPSLSNKEESDIHI